MGLGDELVEDGPGNLVQSSLSLWADHSGEELTLSLGYVVVERFVSLIVGSHKDAGFFESLEGGPDVTSGDLSVVGSAAAVVLFSSIEMSHSADTDLRSEVHSSGDRS